MRFRVAVATCGFASLALVWARPANAQNYRELPIGGRTATMGGAATAAGNDSAMPYLNPAGLAGVPGDIFAVSATVYSFTHRSVRDFFYPNGTPPELDYEIEREDFATRSVGELPSSVMYFNQLSDPKANVRHHLGISLVIPATRQVEIVASVRGRLEPFSGEFLETQSLTIDAKRYYLGPTYAFGVGESLRLGVSAYLAYFRGVSTAAFTSTSSFLGGSTTLSSSGQNSQLEESFSFAPIVGAQAQIFRNVWGGFGFALPSLPISGRLRFNSGSSSSTIDPTSGIPVSSEASSTADLTYTQNDPLRLNVGIAYDNRKSFSAAADVVFYAGRITREQRGVQVLESRRSGEIARSFNRRMDSKHESDSVIDFSVGTEVVVMTGVSVRGGFFSDLAASPEIRSRDEDLRRLRLDRYGGTLGLGFLAGSFDTTAGVAIVRGTGKYGAPDTDITGEIVPVEATETTAMLVLSGAVTVEEAKKKIRDTLPFDLPVLPDLGGKGAPPAPRVPAPLPPASKPPLPPLKSQPPAPPPAPVPPAVPEATPAPDSLPPPPQGPTIRDSL